jgi:hypothetical protein
MSPSQPKASALHEIADSCSFPRSARTRGPNEMKLSGLAGHSLKKTENHSFDTQLRIKILNPLPVHFAPPFRLLKFFMPCMMRLLSSAGPSRMPNSLIFRFAKVSPRAAER